ncbi:transmembrane protein 135-like isoform X2 [Daktulosphaira vitifoliae]|uniref:transmembrane protein 135-like isoform X2 n=1 Tax=Daktulosphaira vitifoliae TaxID=58002 RepID=UPI0021AA45EB|nr:transmembrane protein 135-like isoform X2 [Daktulosphaira vitifoliae]
MIFSKNFVHRTCGEIIHPWNQNCFQAYMMMIRSATVGCSKLIFPIMLGHYIVKIKKSRFEKKHIKNFIIDLLKMITFGVSACVLFVAFNCLIRNLVGKFTLFTVCFIPGFLAGLSSLVLTNEYQNSVTIIFCNASLESCILKIRDSGIFFKNLKSETIFFMITNAFLMYFSQKSKIENFSWFYRPKNNANKKNSEHDIRKKLFSNELNNKVKQYFIFGFAMGILRTIVGDITILSHKRIHRLFKMRILKSGVFTASYVAIYELVFNFLCQKYRNTSTNFALLAGFLAGIPYAIDPILQINVSAFINLIQILYNMIHIDVLKKKKPIRVIIFCLSLGVLCHFRFVLDKQFSKIGKKVIKTATNGLR